MPLKILDSGTLRTIQTLYIRQSGVNRRIRSLKVMDGGTLRTVAVFADPLTVSASPTSVSGTQSGEGPITVNTSSTTATPSGGLGPFTYSWAYVSGGISASANSPASATTSFRAEPPPGSFTSTMRVTVTDAFGQTATADVSATFNNVYSGAGA